MQTSLPPPLLLQFQLTPTTTHNPDWKERAANFCLYYLRESLGSECRLPTSADGSIELIHKTNSVGLKALLGLIAFTIWLPFTIIGIVLNRCSRTHYEGYRQAFNTVVKRSLPPAVPTATGVVTTTAPSHPTPPPATASVNGRSDGKVPTLPIVSAGSSPTTATTPPHAPSFTAASANADNKDKPLSSVPPSTPPKTPPAQSSTASPPSTPLGGTQSAPSTPLVPPSPMTKLAEKSLGLLSTAECLSAYQNMLDADRAKLLNAAKAEYLENLKRPWDASLVRYIENLQILLGSALTNDVKWKVQQFDNWKKEIDLISFAVRGKCDELVSALLKQHADTLDKFWQQCEWLRTIMLHNPQSATLYFKALLQNIQNNGKVLASALYGGISKDVLSILAREMVDFPNAVRALALEMQKKRFFPTASDKTTSTPTRTWPNKEDIEFKKLIRKHILELLISHQSGQPDLTKILNCIEVLTNLLKLPNVAMDAEEFENFGEQSRVYFALYSAKQILQSARKFEANPTAYNEQFQHFSDLVRVVITALHDSSLNMDAPKSQLFINYLKELCGSPFIQWMFDSLHLSRRERKAATARSKYDELVATKGILNKEHQSLARNMLLAITSHSQLALVGETVLEYALWGYTATPNSNVHQLELPKLPNMAEELTKVEAALKESSNNAIAKPKAITLIIHTLFNNVRFPTGELRYGSYPEIKRFAIALSHICTTTEKVSDIMNAVAMTYAAAKRLLLPNSTSTAARPADYHSLAFEFLRAILKQGDEQKTRTAFFAYIPFVIAFCKDYPHERPETHVEGLLPDIKTHETLNNALDVSIIRSTTNLEKYNPLVHMILNGTERNPPGLKLTAAEATDKLRQRIEGIRKKATEFINVVQPALVATISSLLLDYYLALSEEQITNPIPQANGNNGTIG